MAVNALVFDAYGTLYDTQSVAALTEETFPGRGELITAVWRQKQLEYTWLRSLMGEFRDFWSVTRESLEYTLDAAGVAYTADQVATILNQYLELAPFPEAFEALKALKDAGYRLAILSNGEQRSLDTLVRHTGFDTVLDDVITVDGVQRYKPDPAVYELVRSRLGVALDEALFVSANAFDACSAKANGLQVAWIERVPAAALHKELAGQATTPPSTVFKMLRMQMEKFGGAPDHRLSSLSELREIVG
ncbi:2-haloacid dehalogenase [Limimonas halophila]|uniref:(S)-2-haloacid dehalogenase n=1 Tax=Limimonas halophila TaxID=1082479 RepID=A0A1G7M297_9PROT|nr:haloacid dehalogenase type II [Limimonas halophila]SDF55746.1 2-haloacid dehalogenase [Limimonas halophila]